MSLDTTSATGGYLWQQAQEFPEDEELLRFLHGMFVGLTGIDAALIRQLWVEDPLQRPDAGVDWLAFGIIFQKPDANPVCDTNGDEYTQSRMEILELLCAFYGPNRFRNAGALRDGLCIRQNTETLRKENMGVLSIGETVSVPELVGVKWEKRADIPIRLSRGISRRYKIERFSGARLELLASGSVLMKEELEIGTQ